MKIQRFGADDPAKHVAALLSTSATIGQHWDELVRCRTAWADLQPASALASFDQFEEQRLARQEMETAALRFGLALADAFALVATELNHSVPAVPEAAPDSAPDETPTDTTPVPPTISPAAATHVATELPDVADLPTEPLNLPASNAELVVMPTAQLADSVPQPAPVLLSAGHLQRLQAQLSGSAAHLKAKSPIATRSPDVAGPAIRRDEALEEVYRHLGRLTNTLDSMMEIRGEAGFLAKATQELSAGLYGDLDPSDRTIVQRWLAMRWQIARAAAQRSGDQPAILRLQETNRVCQQLRERYPTPFAHGWGKDHLPGATSWREELAQLELMVLARLGRLVAVSSSEATLGLKAKPSAKPRIDSTPSSDDDSDDPIGPAVQLGPDDPLGALTQGKSALLVGGDARTERLPRIQAYFGFRDLEWFDLPENDARRLPALEHRITSGKWDYCIVLQRFSRHRISELVWDNCGRTTTKAVLAESYGIQALRRGLARYLGVAPTFG